MARTPQRKQTNGCTGATTVRRFPRMPAPQQRRLDDLLDKIGEGTISSAERRELKSILDVVDRNTFWGLADMMMRQLDRRKKAAS
jgi:hypothetical protein